MLVNVAPHQDLFKEESVFAQLQKHNGMPTQRPATALQTPLVTIVKPVQLQDSGTLIKRNVFAHHLKLNGIPQPKNANAQQESMEISVLNAQHQDTGI